MADELSNAIAVGILKACGVVALVATLAAGAMWLRAEARRVQAEHAARDAETRVIDCINAQAEYAARFAGVPPRYRAVVVQAGAALYHIPGCPYKGTVGPEVMLEDVAADVFPCALCLPPEDAHRHEPPAAHEAAAAPR